MRFWYPTLVAVLASGNFVADPRFMDPIAGDYRFLDDSPAIGAGAILGADVYLEHPSQPRGSKPDVELTKTGWPSPWTTS